MSRKIISLGLLVAVSLAVTSASNSFFGTIDDFAHNLYFAGLASLACGLLIHVFIVRRLLPVSRAVPQLAGVAISGVIAILLHDLFRDMTAHITFALRKGTTINWGDDGMYSGLPALGTGFDLERFVGHLPATIAAALIYGIVWIPLLVVLERWAYSPIHSPDDSSCHAPA